MELLTSASGVQVTNSNSISWEHELVGPTAAGTALLVFIGGVDSQNPSPTSATFSGTGVSPISEKVLSNITAITSPGGQSFPCGWVFLFAAPVTETGTVTGTIDVQFDESIGRMSGMSAIISGTTGTLDGAPATSVLNTQLPLFNISNTFIASASGSIGVDLCVSESSNHNEHIITNYNEHAVPSGQALLGDLFFAGPKLTTSFIEATSGGPVEMVRSGVGGPHAGTSLTVFGLVGN